jgi:hypothetical protein
MSQSELLRKVVTELSGGSEKQFGDARSVYELQRNSLDLPYIEHWVNILNIAELWQRLQLEADRRQP